MGWITLTYVLIKYAGFSAHFSSSLIISSRFTLLYSMKRYAIIPTRESVVDCDDKTTTVGKLNRFLTVAGWEVHFIRHAKSMLGALRTGVEECGIKTGDYVIYCHDDIEILNNVEYFNGILDAKLKNPKTGFTGIAGTAILTDTINWFACSRQHNSGGGMVYHGEDYDSMYLTPYGPAKDVVTLDGCFLATTGKTLYEISLRAPSSWKSAWHHYDTFLTFQAHIKKKVNKISPISLRHASGGDYNNLYLEDIPRVAQSFAKHLPAVIH